MAGDPDNVLVIHELDSLDSARSFLADPQLHDAMVGGGVKANLASSSLTSPPSGTGHGLC